MGRLLIHVVLCRDSVKISLILSTLQMHFGWFIAIVFLVFITFLICWGFCHHYLNRNKTRKSGKRREGIKLQNKHSLQRVFNWLLSFQPENATATGGCWSYLFSFHHSQYGLALARPAVEVVGGVQLTIKKGRGRVIHEVRTHFRGVKSPPPPPPQRKVTYP